MGRALDYQTQILLQGYIEELRKIYGEHLQKIILYGSRARGDFREDSDYDIMILTDLDELSQKKYQKDLSYMPYDFSRGSRCGHQADCKGGEILHALGGELPILQEYPAGRGCAI